MGPLRHYQAMAVEQQARTRCSRFLLDLAADADELDLVADCLRSLGVSDDEIHQALNDECDGQAVMF